DPGITLFLWSLLDADVHELQPFALRLQPEVESIFLFGYILGMENHVGKKPVTVDATHDTDVLKLKRQVLTSPIVLQDKHTAVRSFVLLDRRLHGNADLLLGNLLHTALGCSARGNGEHNPHHTAEPKCLPRHDPTLHIVGQLLMATLVVLNDYQSQGPVEGRG